jgi:Domain of unknown function (DUF1905)
LEFEFEAELWEYPSTGAWFFVTIPTDISKEIKSTTAGSKRGFGSVRVLVTSDGVAWETSIFPDAKTKTYLLPVKKQVRQQLGLSSGSVAQYRIALSEF